MHGWPCQPFEDVLINKDKQVYFRSALVSTRLRHKKYICLYAYLSGNLVSSDWLLVGRLPEAEVVADVDKRE